MRDPIRTVNIEALSIDLERIADSMGDDLITVSRTSDQAHAHRFLVTAMQIRRRHLLDLAIGLRED